MSNNMICPDCGGTDIRRDFKRREVYCNHCGLILDSHSFVEEDHTWETSHEPLSDGLTLKKEMAKKERRSNFKSPSKKQYENLVARYYDLLENELKMKFKSGEIKDIFNYCFLNYYIVDINSNAKREKQEKVIKDFLNSLRFEKFNVKASVSKINISNSVQQLGFYGELDERTVNRILGRQNYRYNLKNDKKFQKKQ